MQREGIKESFIFQVKLILFYQNFEKAFLIHKKKVILMSSFFQTIDAFLFIFNLLDLNTFCAPRIPYVDDVTKEFTNIEISNLKYTELFMPGGTLRISLLLILQSMNN